MRTVILVVSIALVHCQNNEPTTIKASTLNEPKNKRLGKLFQALIGRSPNTSDKSLIDELKDKTYEKQVDGLLASEQFVDEGFYHLQARRLLLEKRTIEANTDPPITEIDWQALKLEMRDVAESTNYWDILSYRDRWLPFEGLFIPRSCLVTIYPDANDQGAKQQCEIFLKAILHPLAQSTEDFNCMPQLDENNKRTIVERNFSAEYRPRCCSQQVINSKYHDFCRELDNRYTILFGENFCTVARKTPSKELACPTPAYLEELAKEDKRYKPQSKDASGATWDDEQRKLALNTYLSLFLGYRSDDWFSAEATDFNYDLLKVKNMPATIQGIHASPVWLWTHKTSIANQHLHRARVIYHSWFCSEISPDQASTGGGEPADTDQFVKYFADDDQHAKGDNNCFGCHKIVQPLANHFGQLAGASFQEFDGTLGLRTRLLARPGEGFKRSAGFWNPSDKKFYGENEKWFDKGGMEGLAGLLSTMPNVKNCLVKATWSTMIGAEYPLTLTEIESAVKIFASKNNFRELLKHLLNSDKAIAYFQSNLVELNEFISSEKQICKDIEDRASDKGITANQIIKNHCAMCHLNGNTKNFLNEDSAGGYSFARVCGTDNKDCLQVAYSRVSCKGDMPLGGFQGDNAELKKSLLECYLSDKIGDNVSCANEETDLSQMHKIIDGGK